ALGHLNYACALVDIRANMELKESMVIAIPNLKANGVILHMVRVEYEWEPLRTKVRKSANSKIPDIRRQEMEEIVHVTFSEDDEAISQSSTEGDAINFNENRSFPDDEFLELRSEVFVTSEDPPEFTEADNHPALNEPDQTESADHFQPVEPQNNVC
ncbi:hypothetical protein Tco_0928005, partial [Tanacetum coccineum]